MTKSQYAHLSSEIKKANQRIASLEKQGLAKCSAGYDRLKFFESRTEFIFTRSKSGHLKFRTDIKKLEKFDKRELQRLKNYLNTFLHYNSSYVGKVKKAKEKTENFLRNRGFKEEDFDLVGEFMSSEYRGALDLASEQAIDMLAQSSQAELTREEIYRWFEEMKDKKLSYHGYLKRLEEINKPGRPKRSF